MDTITSTHQQISTSLETSVSSNQHRLLSLDALRGFDMFWIAGGGLLIRTLAKGTEPGWLSFMADQVQHVKWEGFHFYDLIFPLFMFISGVAIPLSVLPKVAKGFSQKALVIKAARRMIILIALGIVYNGTLRDGFSNPFLSSVLGQIGIAYFLTSLIIIYQSSFKRWGYWLAGILVGYSIIQLLVPVPGIGAGVLTPEGCINGYIDRMFLPGKLHGGTFDPVGWLCIFSATGITLMGSLAGHILKNPEGPSYRKIYILSSIGAGLILLALMISPFYPIIKSCWTTTFNLLTGGISFLLLAIFYMVIDVWGCHKWSFFFRVIGVNSIFIYLLVPMVKVDFTAKFLFGWIAGIIGGRGGELAIVIGTILLSWSLLYYMYNKKIFLKI